MNNLKIEQDGISELVDTKLIQKLYETASSIPKPLGKQQDNAYMSGRLEVPKTYRNQVQYLAGNINGESNSEGRFKDLRIDVTIGYYITFQDPEVERVLLTKNISSDGIGITEADAANYTGSMNSWFDGNTTVTTFDELKYFTNTKLERTFNGCSNLTSVDLSKVRQIWNSAFRDCTKLNIEVNIPNLISGELGWSAFENSGITKILDLGSCTKIQESCFRGCSNLTEVILSTVCTTIQKNVFQNCINLHTINVENIMYIGAAVFSDCTSISHPFYFKELLEQNNDKNDKRRNSIFVGGSPYIYAPKLQSLGGGYDRGGNNCRGAFINSGWNSTRSNKKIVYFRDLSSVETGAFCGGIVKHLIINNSTIPTVTAHADQNQDLLIDVSGDGVSNSVVQNVWVPDSAVDSYKQHQYWGEFGNKIQGLSGMNKVATKELWDQLSDSAKEDTLIEAYM